MIDSFIIQTFIDIKIICVDDGSIDNSLSILKNIKNDALIVILHQKNKKTGVAKEL